MYGMIFPHRLSTCDPATVIVSACNPHLVAPMRSYATAEVVFVALLVFNAVLWSQSSYSQRPGHALLFSGSHVSKRSLLDLLASEQYGSIVEDMSKDKVCDPIHFLLHLSICLSVSLYLSLSKTNAKSSMTFVPRLTRSCPSHTCKPIFAPARLLGRLCSLAYSSGLFFCSLPLA